MARPGKEWSPKGMHVWVLLYDHRSGLDVFVFGTEDKAFEAAVQIAMEEIDSDIKAEVGGLFKKGEFREALKVWQEWQYSSTSRSETIDIIHEIVR